MRPSLAATREAEMLAAIEACIVEVGVGGLTTQLVAEKSGYSRSHIRHYLGNKADQLQALIKVYSDRYASSLEDSVRAAAPGEQRLIIFRELFGDTWLVPDEDNVILEHLNAYTSANPGSGVSLAPMYRRVGAVIAEALEEALPAAIAAERAGVVVAFAYGAATMMDLGVLDLPSAREQGRRLLELPSPT